MIESNIEEYIALDAHKHYSWLEREDRQTGRTIQGRIEHSPGAIRNSLGGV